MRKNAFSMYFHVVSIVQNWFKEDWHIDIGKLARETGGSAKNNLLKAMKNHLMRKVSNYQHFSFIFILSLSI